MSGGSYDYASYEMENGGIDKALRYLDSATSDLAEILARPAAQVYETEERINESGQKYKVGIPRPTTDAERLLTEMAVGALAARLAKAARAFDAARNAAKDMAELFHQLEWLASGDTGIDSFQAWAREWARLQLESTTITPTP